MSRLSAKTRKQTATVVVNGKPKYPINDAQHAQLALARMDQAHPPLTSTQKAQVRRKAARYGVSSQTKKDS